MTALNAIRGPEDDLYRERVERVYEGDTGIWKEVLGESLFFHLGVYDGVDRTLAEAATAYVDAQLALAGLVSYDQSPRRVLDIGCGWGSVIVHLARRFPTCERFDGINISTPQLEYAAALMAENGIAERVALHQCDAQDIDLLPDPTTAYDLVIARGSVAHFTDAVLERAVAALSRRTRAGSKVVIAEVLYDNPGAYRPAIADTVDRLACGHRKTPDQVKDVLRRHGFTVADARVLPSVDDAVRWFTTVRDNIDTRFPGSAPLPALDELRTVATNLAGPLVRGEVLPYSIVAIRD
jgi:cyclopropane fatty-acyl-phospholipid synthase-like methyltransferase